MISLISQWWRRSAEFNYFKHVVSSIIEAQDLATFSMKDLIASLKGHEGRLDLEDV